MKCPAVWPATAAEREGQGSMKSMDYHRSFYRPQRSWGKVMFLQASVILLTGGGVSASVHAGIPPGADTPLGADTPWEQTLQEQTPPGSRHPPGADTPQSRHTPLHSILGDTVNARPMRIPLECNLVYFVVRFTTGFKTIHPGMDLIHFSRCRSIRLCGH